MLQVMWLVLTNQVALFISREFMLLWVRDWELKFVYDIFEIVDSVIWPIFSHF